MLWKRIATAAVLVPLMVASILFSAGRPAGWPFLLLCAVAAALCADEGFRMFLHGAQDRAGGVALAVLVFFRRRCCRGPSAYRRFSFASSCRSSSPFRVRPTPRKKARRAATLCLGAVTVGDFCRRIRGRSLLPRGEHWVLLGSSVAAGDTMAYFTGRAIGRRKLAPRPSRRTRRSKARSGASSGASAAPSSTRTVFSRGAGGVRRGDGAAVGIFRTGGGPVRVAAQARGG